MIPPRKRVANGGDGRRGRGVALAMVLAALALSPAYAQDLPPDVAPRADERELFLEVFINGRSTEMIASFREERSGGLSADPTELANVGIAPNPAARDSHGRILLDRLPAVRFEYQEATQTISFTADGPALAPRILDAGRRAGESETPTARADLGGIVNYALFASTTQDPAALEPSFDGLSAYIQPRIVGAFGVFSHSQVFSTDDNFDSRTVRLDTTWAYSDPRRLMTYRAGDLIGGGLTWTRPVRLGGVQIQRDFGLRPDLVTFPTPNLTGSAAVPSTVEVYVDNARRFTGEVAAGPFTVKHLPVVTGAGTARVVVRDVLGREVASESAFFASSSLLADGLTDFSAELGYARRYYGISSADYDDRLVGTATVRRGITDGLTLEAHAEGAADLVNAGVGAVFGVGPLGVASLAGAASDGEHGTGFLAAAQLDVEVFGVRGFLRSQRTFGDYGDIASVTAEGIGRHRDAEDGFNGVRPPREIDQAMLSMPLKFDPSSLSLSYTRLEDENGLENQVAGLSYSRPMFRNSTLFASAYASLDDGDFGFYAGLSIPLSPDTVATASVSDGTTASVDVDHSAGRSVGELGWHLRATAGEQTQGRAAATYGTEAAQFAGSIEAGDGFVRGTGEVDGSLVVTDTGVYAANRIDDAFAVVDVGAPGVDVYHENRFVGRTRSDGRLLVSGLRSYERNQLSFDPSELPLDAVVGATRQVVVPSARSGVAVGFDVDAAAKAAVVVFRNPDGSYVEAGSLGRLAGGDVFVVGYDGTAYIPGLAASNNVEISTPAGDMCAAAFTFTPDGSPQPFIPDVECRS